MITGDNPLTACHVARELHFLQKEHTLILQQNAGQSNYHVKQFFIIFKLQYICECECDVNIIFTLLLAHWQWESIDGSVCVPMPPPTVSSLVHKFDLCVTGEGLARLSCEPRLLNTLLPHIQVFARVSPKQKVCWEIQANLV